MPSLIFYSFVFILGSVIGSFLGVLSDRLPQEKTIRGRSKCGHCGKTLEWFDLIPIFSFLFLGGKCRRCKKSISSYHFWIEAITGLAFLVVAFYLFPLDADLPEFQWLNWQLLIQILFWLFLASCFIAVFFADLRFYIIPDEIIIAGIGCSLIYRIWLVFNSGFSLISIEAWRVFLFSFLAALLAGGFFFSLNYFSRGRWMGMGDAKLALFLGLALGWPSILIGLFLSFLTGSIIGLGLVFWGKASMKSQVPFGVFLTASSFACLFWGEKIADWYLSLFR
jgi:prepilin signal peptidase PulO-like enzyme (type II secretory pathway)